MKDAPICRCSSCGRVLPFEDTICPYCGNKVKNKAGRKLWKPISLLTVVLLLLLQAFNFLQEAGLSGSLGDLIWNIRDWAENRREEELYPEPDIQYYTVPEEEIDALDADAFWRKPDLWLLEYPDLTEDQLQAMEDLAGHLEYSTASEAEARMYLTELGYSDADIDRALECSQPDWEIQALKSALVYLEFGAWSYRGLGEQLEYSSFLPEEIEFALEHCGADWEEQTRLAVEELTFESEFSKTGMVQRLTDWGFPEEAVAAEVNAVDMDWNANALRCARSYLEMEKFSAEEMLGQLLYEGFTQEQAEYAVAELRLR